MKKIALVCAEFNKDLTEGLLLQAEEALRAGGFEPAVYWTPGAGEIPLTVKWLLDNKQAQSVLALGAVIRGQTAHFDFLCGFLEKALWDLQNTYSAPIVFSVIMAENRKQAEERVKKARGGEGAQALLKMIELKENLKKK